MEKEMKMLGFKARDKVTGFEGVITSVSFELYGCIQYLLNPGMTKENKLGDCCWFDTNRIEIVSKKPVMECKFSVDKGGDLLPLPRSR